MKVSLITLHYVRNYGSLLQTYATQKILERLGAKVEVVNFIPKGLSLKCGILTIRKTGNLFTDFVRTFAAFICFSLIQLSVKRFLHKYIHVGQIKYSSFEEIKKKPPEADIYLCGSDQIWNTQNANEKDDVKAYYLDFVPPGKIKAAYASSIGKEKFTQEEARQVRNMLEGFSAISVREMQAVEILCDIGIKNVVHVLDPTLLLTAAEWSEFAVSGHKLKKPYLFVYNLNRNQQVKQFAMFAAKQDNLRIVNISNTWDRIRGADNIFNCPAEFFLNLLANAEYVITDSFHGTAFSINFGKKFLTFAAPNYNSRIVSILTQFGLMNRFIAWGEKPSIDLLKDGEDLIPIKEQLIKRRTESLQFLNKVLQCR